MSGGMDVSASIVIPTVGRPDLLADLLHALESQEGSFEVVVVCDGEHPGTRELSAGWSSPYPLKWVFCGENRGLPTARNVGADNAEGRVLVFLDDDTVPAPGWLQAHLRHHEEGRGGRVVLGRLRHEYPQGPCTNLERFMRRFSDRVQDNLERSLARMDNETVKELWVGLNSSLPAPVFKSSGGYDPVMRYVQEESELAARMVETGVEFLYEPDALIYHKSTKDLARLHLSRAEAFAETDLYRLRQKRQEAAKWPMLASLRDSNGTQRLKHRLSWRLPRLASAIGGICRAAGEALGIEFLLRQWCDLAFMTRYWGRVKADGLSRDDVLRLLES